MQEVKETLASFTLYNITVPLNCSTSWAEFGMTDKMDNYWILHCRVQLRCNDHIQADSFFTQSLLLNFEAGKKEKRKIFNALTRKKTLHYMLISATHEKNAHMHALCISVHKSSENKGAKRIEFFLIRCRTWKLKACYEDCLLKHGAFLGFWLYFGLDNTMDILLAIPFQCSICIREAVLNNVLMPHNYHLNWANNASDSSIL